MFKRIAMAVISVVAIGTIPATAANAVAAPTVHVVRVGTDAMGTDNFDNRNREYVRFKVSGAPAETFDVTGIKIEDNWAHFSGSPSSCNTYTISALPDGGDAGTEPDSTVVAVGTTITVFNGNRVGGNYSPAANQYNLYANSDIDCGTFGHFLNNDADKVWVTKGDAVIAEKAWDWGGGYSIPFFS